MIISVGGISIELRDKIGDSLPSNLLPYVVSTPAPTASCEGIIGPVPTTTCDKSLFDSGWTWRVESMDRGIRLCVLMGETKKVPYHVVEFNEDLTDGKIWLDNSPLVDGPRSFLLRDPLHELWTSFLLMRGRGLLVHGLGVLNNGKVSLFVGKSGTGKSTLANVFKEAGIGEILSDDRLVLRPTENGYQVFGTPWHGEARFASAGVGRLDAIYFLEQSPMSQILPLGANEIVSRFFSVCFIAGWPRQEGMQFILDSCAEVAQRVPSFRLRFTPDSKTLGVLGLI